MSHFSNIVLSVALVVGAAIWAVAQDQDAGMSVAPNFLTTEGQWKREPASKELVDTDVVIHCDREMKVRGECLLASAWIENGKLRVNLAYFSVVRWTEDEVLAERDALGLGDLRNQVGVVAPTCYNTVLLIKLATPFRGKYPESFRKGTTTLTITRKAFAEDEKSFQKMCERDWRNEPALYRLVR